jgi:RNA polymerase sigma factor (sigma-70 family)
MPSNLTNLVHRLRRLAGSPTVDSDADLLGRFARRRDEDAFAALVARHGPMVFGVCRRVLHDAHAAEDAAQATFLVLARRAGSIGQPDRLPGWLYGVAYKVASKARCGSLRRGETALDSDRADGRPDPLAEVSARELLDALEAELGKLPEAYRLPLVLCCLEGLSQEEAAGRLGCSPDSIRGRLERGRRRLHERLVRRGLELPAALAAVVASRGEVSAALVRGTVRGAVAFAAGGGGVSQQVIALANGGLKAMFWTKMKVALVVLALSGAIGSGAGWVMTGGREPAGGGLVSPVAAAGEPEQKAKPKEKVDKADKALIDAADAALEREARREEDRRRLDAANAALAREALLARARKQLDDYAARNAAQDQTHSKNLIAGRQSLADLEGRIREIEGMVKATETAGAEELLLLKEEQRYLEEVFRSKYGSGLTEPKLSQFLKSIEKQQAGARAELAGHAAKRLDTRAKALSLLRDTRKEMIAKEEEMRWVERSRDVERQHEDRMREMLFERIHQLEGTAVAAPDRAAKALDRRLDAIQRELSELRREIRRRKE